MDNFTWALTYIVTPLLLCLVIIFSLITLLNSFERKGYMEGVIYACHRIDNTTWVDSNDFRRGWCYDTKKQRIIMEIN